MIIAPTYRGVRKPPVASTINWGHPLARGLKICALFNEGRVVDEAFSGTLARNYADPSNPAVAFNTNQLNPVTAAGRGGGSRGLINNSANAPGLKYNKIPLNGVAQFSMFVRAMDVVNGISAPGPVFLAATAPIVSFSQYQNGLYTYGQSTSGWHFVVTTGAQVFLNAGFISGVGGGNVMVDACGVYDGVNAIFYGNGSKMLSSAQSGTVSTSTTLSHFADTTASSSETYIGAIACAMLWTRALTPAEVLSLSISPYQMFRTASLPRWLVSTAGGGGGGGGLGIRRTLAITGARTGARQVHRS